MARFTLPKKWKLRDVLALLLPVQMALVSLFAKFPSGIERYYSEGLYPLWSQLNRMLWGWLPFSIGDLLYTAFGGWALWTAWKGLKRLRKYPWESFKYLLATLSLVYGIFYWGWGLNYFRIPLEEKLGISSTYETQELDSLTRRLIELTNAEQLAITGDSTKPVELPYSRKEVYRKTATAYKKASADFGFLKYSFPSQKTSLYSLPLTYMGYAGYLNPFSGEAQVNGKIPAFRWPSVSAHEVGHQLGYSAEDDTNFIGYWICIQSEDPYFRYAAYSSTLAYMLSDLRRRDPEAYERYFPKINEGVVENYRQLRRFWDSYENPTEPLFKAAFDGYLKANNQSAGIASYSRVVGLIIGFDRQYGLFPRP